MPLGRDKTKRGEVAVFGLVVHIPHFIAFDGFQAHPDSYIRQVKDTPLAEGATEIRLPGERGFREHRRRVVEGVAIPDDVWGATVRLAEANGVDWREAIEQGS